MLVSILFLFFVSGATPQEYPHGYANYPHTYADQGYYIPQQQSQSAYYPVNNQIYPYENGYQSYPVYYQNQPSYQYQQPSYQYVPVYQNQQPSYQYQQPEYQYQQLGYQYQQPSYQYQPVYTMPPGYKISNDVQANYASANNTDLTVKDNNSTSHDPYANVKTEIIDVSPDVFNSIMRRLNVAPTIISQETRLRKSRVHAPIVVVQSESKQQNSTAVPAPISQNKIFVFNKTYVFHPGQDGKKVINLNFVNGEEVTDAPPEKLEKKDKQETTTSIPKKEGKKFIDVPAGCEEGSEYSATGGCFSPFSMHSHKKKNSTATDERSRIKVEKTNADSQ